MRAITPFLLLLLLSPPASVADGGAFYGRWSDGWFWYEPEPKKPPEMPPEETPEPAQPAASAEPSPKLPTEAPAGPSPLSAAWLRENLEAYRDAAIDDPSPQNVALYLYLQRFAVDKADRFAEATQQAVLRDPFLDENTQQPIASFAANLANHQAAEARDETLTALAKTAGIWFFHRADCPYCEAQAPLLQVLSSRYGFGVQAIAIDGRSLPSGLYPDYKTDRGQARRLGVVATPALFLVRPPDQVLPLAQGVLSLTQLQARILTAAAEAQWIAPSQFQRTRPRQVDLRMASGLTPSSELTADPAALLEWMRASARTPSAAGPATIR